MRGQTVTAMLATGPKYRDQAERVVVGPLVDELVRVVVGGEAAARKVNVERLDGCP
jgi:hypothetical protein